MLIPPGYRFVPTDSELVVHYLEKKLLNQELGCDQIHVVELYEHTPQELIDRFKVSGEKFVFILTQRMSSSSGRTKRLVKGETGYWKITGSETPIIDDEGQQVGKKGSLVFYMGKGKTATKTDYIMHELKKNAKPNPGEKEWVICQIHDNTKIKELNQVRSNTIPLPLPPLEQSPPLNPPKRPCLNSSDQSHYFTVNPHISSQPSASSFSPPTEQPLPLTYLRTHLDRIEALLGLSNSDSSIPNTISAHPSPSHIMIKNLSKPSTSTCIPTPPLKSTDTILEESYPTSNPDEENLLFKATYLSFEQMLNCGNQ